MNAGIELVGLVTVVPQISDSWMFHTVNIKWTKLHAEAMKVNQYFINVSGEKEREVEELLKSLKSLQRNIGFNYITVGAVASKYQYMRIKSIAEKLGVKVFAPLWGKDPYQVLNEEVNEIKFMLIAVQAYGLNEKWIGKVISKVNVNNFMELCKRYGISPVGEGGEFETFTLSSPLFHGKEIVIKSFEKLWYPTQWVGYLIIKDAVLR